MVDFRDSLIAKRISILLILSILLDITCPAFAEPWWECKPDYPQARNRQVRKPVRHYTKDAQFADVLKRNQAPVAKLPAFHGQRPLDGVGDYESGSSTTTTPSSATGTTSNPTAQATPSEGETPHASPSPTARTAESSSASSTEEPIQAASSSDDCGCGNVTTGDSGAELGYVDADPRKPFPQLEYSRQTYDGGPYLPTGQEIPAVHVQDHLLHIARTLDNPGEREDYTLDVVSPKAEDNGITERNSTASVRWSYWRLSGARASAFDAKYQMEIRVWDRRSPNGRVVFAPKRRCGYRGYHSTRGLA